MRLAGDCAPARHHEGIVAARAAREQHRRRLPVRLHLEPDAGEHLRDRGADGAVAGQAVVGEMEADLEAVGIPGLGQELARALNVGLKLGELLVVAEDAGGHHLVDRTAEALHRHLGERRAVDREIDGLAHPRVLERVLRQG